MTAAPLISIVLPTFNGSRYLAGAIESCLHQTFKDWELILVDDASTDSSPAVMAEYAARDSRIRVVRNEVNSKLPKSLNNGFALARGEFLTWTSDDNCYRPEALTAMLDYLQGHREADIVYAKYTVIDEHGKTRWVGPTGAGCLNELPFRNIVGACFLYRRTVHEQLRGYAEDLFLVEDYDFWLRASARFNLRFLDRDLYLYRWHSQSLTVQQTEKIKAARERALTRNLAALRWLPRTVWRKAWLELVGLALERGDPAAARARLRQSATRDPLMPFRLDLPSASALFFPAPINRLVQQRQSHKRGQRLQAALKELRCLIPGEATFILVDEEQLRGEINFGRALPFLEKDGEWWGAPEDDASAIEELERMRRTGAEFVVFAFPAFWWLEHYRDFTRHLEARYRVICRNDQVLAYDLRGQSNPS